MLNTVFFGFSFSFFQTSDASSVESVKESAKDLVGTGLLGLKPDVEGVSQAPPPRKV